MTVGKGTGAIIGRIPSYNTTPAEGAAIGRSDLVSGALCRRRKKGLEEKATKKVERIYIYIYKKKKRKQEKKTEEISTLSPLPSPAVGLCELREEEEKGRKKKKKDLL